MRKMEEKRDKPNTPKMNAFQRIHLRWTLFQLKYKRRVYKMMSLDEKQLKSLHTRANLRRFLDYVTNGQVEKITKMCSKGLDPNFHCQDSGGKIFSKNVFHNKN